jgi:hypothetical protein
MSSTYESVERPDLDEPVMILALEGWIDAGLGARAALTQINESMDPVVVARFDTDDLLDHRARRPIMHLVDGINTGLTWPDIELVAGTDPSGQEVLVLSGAEPDHRWRAFSSDVVDIALDLGVRLVVGLGAYPAPVPHTRPTSLVATATDAQLANLVGFVPGRIDVPGGVAAAIERRCADVGLPAVGLWAQVPHYASGMPYPAAAAALLDGLDLVADVRFPMGSLRDEATAARERLDAAVAGNPEHEAMVSQLESQTDAQPDGGYDVSGDELAAEVERFLRTQGDD